MRKQCALCIKCGMHGRGTNSTLFLCPRWCALPPPLIDAHPVCSPPLCMQTGHANREAQTVSAASSLPRPCLVCAPSHWCAPPPMGVPPLSLVCPPSCCPLTPPLSTCAQNGGHTHPPCFCPPPTPQFPCVCPLRLPPLSTNRACELGARTGVV